MVARQGELLLTGCKLGAASVQWPRQQAAAAEEVVDVGGVFRVMTKWDDAKRHAEIANGNPV